MIRLDKYMLTTIKKPRLLVQSEFDRSGQIVSRSFDYTKKENPSSLEHQTYHGGRPIFTYSRVCNKHTLLNKRSPIYTLYYLNKLYEVQNKVIAPGKKSKKSISVGVRLFRTLQYVHFESTSTQCVEILSDKVLIFSIKYAFSHDIHSIFVNSKHF